MSELVVPSPPASLAVLSDPAAGTLSARLGQFVRQPAVRKMLPAFGGLAAVGLTALAWTTLSPAPQRVLYAQLDDKERAGVVDALDKGGIGYTIDPASGALTVDEDKLYKARMLVASDGALAQPDTAPTLDTLPLGASRTLEGERLRAAREHELTLTIQEIDGVESVRVHLAEGEKSAFVRDTAAPSASVMVRMARGRQLSAGQVSAIANLVAASVPGLNADAVRIADQHGRLLSQTGGENADRLDLQARMEDKLRNQVSALLAPMLGQGNFSSEIQVDLDMEDVTSAREAYDKNGSVVRSETQAQSSTPTGQTPVGVPGALSNTPPPPATAVPGPPQGTPTLAPGAQQMSNEANSSRTYELGREVSVTNRSPGTLKRISVAVAVSGTAMKGAKPADIDQLKQLVSAAVGANPARGDTVAVIVRKFEPATDTPLAFYEAPWFAMVVRNMVALIAVLLVLFIAVRPAVRALTAKREAPPEPQVAPEPPAPPTIEEVVTDEVAGTVNPEALVRQLGYAQRIVEDRPEAAVHALRQMLGSEAAA